MLLVDAKKETLIKTKKIIMEAIERVDYLMNKFRNADYTDTNEYGVRSIVLICIDEIIKTIEFMAESDELDKLPHWNEVKKIIESLQL